MGRGHVLFECLSLTLYARNNLVLDATQDQKKTRKIKRSVPFYYYNKDMYLPNTFIQMRIYLLILFKRSPDAGFNLSLVQSGESTYSGVAIK